MVLVILFNLYSLTFFFQKFACHCPQQLIKMSAGLFALMSKKGREEKRLKELRDAFDAADKDGDGQLTPSEWLNVLKATGVDVSK